MSTTSPSAATATATAAGASSSFFDSLGLGYAIAISLGVLVLLSTLLLVSYLCCRSPRPRGPAPNAVRTDGVVLPRVIFVAEDDDDEDEDEDDDGDEEAAAAGSGRRQSCAVTGLDQVAINSYPKFAFSGAKGGDAVCSVCLCEYREREMLRMMPDCRHYFHLPCIDAWLPINASCPVCRTSPMPTPLSTPLSELVPLSHYAADRRRR